MKQMQMRKIEITTHAKQRLSERMPEINPRDYERMVQSARYRGLTEHELFKESPKFAKEVFKRFHKNNSTEVRFYKDHIFIFCGNKGHSRTLRTVVDVPEYILALQNT
jgi:hypothetical protein